VRAGVVYVDAVADPIIVPALHAPVPEADEYHWYEKIGVPPPSCDVRVMVCPLSMEGDVGVTAPAESAAYTVTVEDAPDVCVSVVVALSVTFNSKL
jgi:hypothetical protein